MTLYFLGGGDIVGYFVRRLCTLCRAGDDGGCVCVSSFNFVYISYGKVLACFPRMAQFHRTPYGICFTINNPTEADFQAAAEAVGKRGITYICWGNEVADSGTPHMQGYLQSTQKQHTRLRLAFNKAPHFQMAGAESGPNAAETAGTFPRKLPNGKYDGEFTAIGYTMKDGDWREFGHKVDLKAVKKGQRSDLMTIQIAINDGQSYDEICDEHFETSARFGRFIRERIQARDTQQQRDALREELSGLSLYPWQEQLVNLVGGAADRRKIVWVWSAAGRTGKSTFATYLSVNHGATLLGQGKKTDLAYIFATQPSRVVVFDLSRTAAPEEGKEHTLDHLYALAEDLKNGRIVSTKYESKTVFFPSPHVIFFANFPPDMSKWSEDRYDIREI